MPSPLIREVGPGLTPEQLAPLEPRCRVVQFRAALAPEEHERLAELMRHHPGVPLRAYGNYDGSIQDLEFLQHYPFLKGFQFDLFDVPSWEGLRHLPDGLEFLAIGQTRSRAHSLAFLSRFRGLRDLHIEGHRKGIETVGQLAELERLSLRSVTLADLSAFTSLYSLHTFELRLGGTRDLGHLPRMGRLRYLEIWQVKGLSDLAPISRLTSLQYLFLQALKGVTALPDLSALGRLRRVHLESMKGLRDLSPLLTAPRLEELALLDAPHMQPEDVACLRNHPALQRASIFMNSDRKNRRIREILPLPDAPSGSEFEFEPA
jgi:hypothetical protein